MFTKHGAINIVDPGNMQDVCHILTSLTTESLWLSSRAPERGIRRSEVRFFTRASEFFLCSTLVTSLSISLPSKRITIFPILFKKLSLIFDMLLFFLCGCPFSFRRFENTFLLKLINLHLESEAWSEIKHSAVKILPNDFLRSHTKNMHWCMHFGALTAICDRTELKF